MNYEINISLNGSHLFATHPRSITDRETFLSVFKVLNLKFPAEEGYQLSASYNPGINYGGGRKAILTAIEEDNLDALFKGGKP